MKTSYLSLFCAALMTGGAQAAINPVWYTFDSYTNDVDGHWTNANGWTTAESGGYFYISNDNSSDGTNYVRFSDSGAGVGATASISNTFGTLDESTATSLLYSYYHGNYWGTTVGLGSSASQGISLASSISDSMVRLYLGGTQLASQTFDFSGPMWTDFRLDVDIGANGGSGSATAYARATGSGVEWTPIDGMAGINLGLDASRTALDSTNPANWNTLWFHEEGADSGIDGVAVLAVPEPSSLVLLSAGILGLMGWRRSRRA